MKKTFFTFLSLIISLSTISAQKGIDFKKSYSAGGKLLMCVDSGAKNVRYANVFPNQPHTSFSYLPDVNNLSIDIYFRKNINVPSFRYTILMDDKPVVVNQAINEAKLKEVDMPDEVFRSTSLGIFNIKERVITVLVYSIEKPQDIEKSVFYGKPIPKAEIQAFSKRTQTEKGVDYSWIKLPKRKADLTFTEKDDQITIVKDKSAIDYLYYTSIIDKRTEKVIFQSTAWQYGGIVDKHEFLPFIDIDRSIFKKSGNYEIIIQPLIKWDDCLNCDMSPEEIEKYVTRHTLSIKLEDENYTKKDFIIYGLIICAVFGAIGGAALTYIKKKEAKKLVQQYKEKKIVELQLSSVRSQLNPHFLFNALAGIQNLMNKNEIDNANKYLAKFARLTRNVLDDKELISLAQEKTLLDDYLQMEKLRFGFDYEIISEENLDLENIEIPSMLSQPFVENAVKHGIASKNKDAKIEVNFIRSANNLILTITDNGKGFEANKQHDGLGLSLSKNRIALLNSIYKETPIVLDINSNGSGTKISFTLTDWL